MKTQSPPTTEETLERLAELSEALMKDDRPDRAIVYEVRALRLMLRDEIREAAWPLKQWAELNYAPIVPRPESMKAPDA